MCDCGCQLVYSPGIGWVCPECRKVVDADDTSGVDATPEADH